MELVFIHGWGFNAAFWDKVAPLLPYPRQRRVDLGYFGEPMALGKIGDDSVLVGHSLGFCSGICNEQGWRGWVSINSFPRFVDSADQKGCVPPAVLRDMRLKLHADPDKTLRDFYSLIGATPIALPPIAENLRLGLDNLRDYRVIPQLKRLNIPGLVVASRHDPLVPVMVSEELGEQGDLIWHETGGHVLPQSDPQFCADHIHNFIEKYFK